MPLQTLRIVFCAASAWALLSATGLAAAQTLEKRERLGTLIGLCSTCHGQQGISTSPEIPALAGQHEPYLLASLIELKGKHSSSPIMQEITRELSDDDLAQLARHFAKNPYVRLPQSVPPERATRGKAVYLRLCQLCHHNEGRSTSYGEYPLLAGQNLAYMMQTMDRILTGQRRVDAIKRDMLSLLQREQIDDAIHFFASQEVTPDQVQTSVGSDTRSRRNRFRTP